MMKASHSSLLDTAMLTTLDSGWALKRLAPGKIEYRTHVTLWAGTQPSRFDLSSGLGRRFYFMYFVPTKKDRRMLTSLRRKGKNVDPQHTLLTEIRIRVDELIKNIVDIETIWFDENLFKLFDEFHIPHFEEPLYERLAIGYNIMTKSPEPRFDVALDDRLTRLIKQEYNWRNMLKYGAHVAQVITILADHDNEMNEDELRSQLVDFGVDFTQTAQLLDSMKRMRLIVIDKDGVVKRR